jgi:hypothetical protein
MLCVTFNVDRDKIIVGIQGMCSSKKFFGTNHNNINNTIISVEL